MPVASRFRPLAILSKFVRAIATVAAIAPQRSPNGGIRDKRRDCLAVGKGFVLARDRSTFSLEG